MRFIKSGQTRKWVDLLIWGIYLVMTGSILFFPIQYGSSLPYGDEWDSTVPFLTGEYSGTPSAFLHYLWEPHSEHRFPLPRLLNVALLRLFHNDFRSVMLFDALLLIFLCFVLLRTARKLRGGHFNLTDVLLPVVLLSWADNENLLWALQSLFIMTTTIAGLLLAIILSMNEKITERQVWQSGCLILLLPLCGGQGLILSVVLTVWFGYAAIVCGATSKIRTIGGVITGAIVLMIGVYLLHLHRASTEGTPPVKVLLVAQEFLGISLGSAIRYGTVPRYLPPAVSLLIVPAFLLVAVTILLAHGREQSERVRAVGLFLLLGGVVLLSLSVGLGRVTGFATRYMILSALSLCTIHFILILYARGRFRMVLSTLLAVVVCALLPFNEGIGWSYGKAHRQTLDDFAADLPRHLPPTLLAMRHADDSAQYPEQIVRKLIQLRDAKVLPFTEVGADPPMHPLSLLEKPSTLHEITVQNGVMKIVGKRAFRVFHLNPPVYVYGVHLHYTYIGGETGVRLDALRFWHIGWKHPDQKVPDNSQQKRIWEELLQSATSQQMIFFLYQKVDAIYLIPEPGANPLQLEDLTLMVGETPLPNYQQTPDGTKPQ